MQHLTHAAGTAFAGRQAHADPAQSRLGHRSTSSMSNAVAPGIAFSSDVLVSKSNAERTIHTCAGQNSRAEPVNVDNDVT